MKKQLLAIAATAAAVSAVLSMSTATFAAEELNEVTVQAKPLTKTTVVGLSLTTGAPIKSVTVDYHVSYADLDLVKHADVLTLNKRVEGAAHDACRQLDELYPVESPKLRECTADAVSGASEQVQSAIAAAQNRPTN